MLNDGIHDFFVSYFGYEPDFLEKKEVFKIFEDLYNSGKHPKLELFVEMNYDLFEEDDL